MEEHYEDILIRIRAYDDTASGHPVEAKLSDGSQRFLDGPASELHLTTTF